MKPQNIRDYSTVTESIQTLLALDDGKITNTFGMTTDNKRRLYVVDVDRGCIGIISLDTFSYLSTYGLGQLKNPRDICFNPVTGNLIVTDTDNHRFCQFDRRGKLLQSTGSFGKGDGQFNRPFGVAVDKEGCIYVTDIKNLRVQVFDKNGKFIRVLHKVNYAGPVSYLHENVHGPCGIGILSNGNIVVSDWAADGLIVMDKEGAFVERLFKDELSWPTFFYIDGEDNIISTSFKENLKIFVFSSRSKKLIHAFDSNSYSRVPRAVTMDPDANIYVSYEDGTISKF